MPAAATTTRAGRRTPPGRPAADGAAARRRRPLPATVRGCRTPERLRCTPPAATAAAARGRLPVARHVDVALNADVDVRRAVRAVRRRLLLPRFALLRHLLPGIRRLRLRLRQGLSLPVGTVGGNGVGAPRPQILNDVNVLPAHLGRRHHQPMQLVSRDHVLVRDTADGEGSEEGQGHQANRGAHGPIVVSGSVPGKLPTARGPAHVLPSRCVPVRHARMWWRGSASRNCPRLSKCGRFGYANYRRSR